MNVIAQKNPFTGRWHYKLVDGLGLEVGRSIVGYPTMQQAASAGHQRDRLNHKARCDLRANESGKFGWKAHEGDEIVGENSVWFDNPAAAIFNASQNGFAVSVGDGVKVPVVNPTKNPDGAAGN